jgi:class 3 adenylate cyclase
LLKQGALYNVQGRFQNAIINCEKGLSITKELGMIAEQKEACACMYDAYKALGNGNKALAYHEMMLTLGDSLNIKETEKRLQQMEFERKMLSDSIVQVEKDRLVKDAHQEEIRKKSRTRNIALGTGFFLLIFAGGLYSRMQYIRKSKAVIEKERDRSDNLLHNILPKEIAQELKEKGKTEARDFDNVSILFSDFKEFTNTSAKLSAQELVTEISVCFEAFDVIMEKYGIEKIKTIGDAYMAAGGLPVPSINSTKATVLAALEMQSFIQNRRTEKGLLKQISFEMRVGIHTGQVVAGVVGLKKFQYDIWGDTVNIASRIESNSEAGKVNISQTTFELLKTDSDFSFISRGKIQAKGKGEIEMYFVSKSRAMV